MVTTTGKPYGGNHFSESFREWCDAAGLPKRCSAHGVRKAACRRGAEDGYSANELASWSGHASLREVERYTKAVDQAAWRATPWHEQGVIGSSRLLKNHFGGHR